MASKKNPKNHRELKVYSKFQSRGHFEYVSIPEIRLMGKWLKESGFTEGADVIVEVQANKLVITPRNE